jgi:HTH-type transcriptional regulator, glycine betaine synthesis regulator
VQATSKMPTLSAGSRRRSIPVFGERFSSFQIELLGPTLHRRLMRELTSADRASNEAQSALERELVAIFSDLADLFGNPRSHGAIYGLLFSSERPLSMEDIMARIGISKGSASQGLRQLEEFGAVARARQNGERTHVYTARIELKPLLAGFLHKRLAPRLTSGAVRLQRLEKLLPMLPSNFRPIARLRLQRITKWHKSARARCLWRKSC